MIGVRALGNGQQVPVVVLLIVALVMSMLLGLGTTAQNILQRPSVNLVPQSLRSSVQEGAIQIREIVKRQINQPSTIGPTFPRVNANPAAILRTRAIVPSTELVPPAPVIVPPAPVIVPAPTKSDKTPAAAKPAAGKSDKTPAAAKPAAKPDKHGDSTKGPGKRN